MVDNQNIKIVAYLSLLRWRTHFAQTKSRKIPKIVATYVYSSSQGQSTHSARTKIPKIVAYGCQTPSAQRRSDQNYLK